MNMFLCEYIFKEILQDFPLQKNLQCFFFISVINVIVKYLNSDATHVQWRNQGGWRSLV